MGKQRNKIITKIKGYLVKTIIESPYVSKEIDKNCKKFSRLSDVFDSIKWRLSRKPESGTRLSVNSDYYLLSNADDIEAVGLPRIVLLYRFNDNEVCIENILIQEIKAAPSLTM